MDLEHIVQESQLDSHRDLFGFHTKATHDVFSKMIRDSFCSNPTRLSKRADIIAILRKCPNRPSFEDPHFQEAESLLRSYVPTEESKTANQQILFTGEHTRTLNQIPFLLTLFVYLKIYIAPVLGLLSPVLLFFMPFIIMRYTMNVPIPWNQYIHMMKTMIFGQQTGSWTLKQYGQAAWTCASMGQTMFQPCFTAYHTYQIDALLVKRGRALQIVLQKGKEILTWFQEKNIAFQTTAFPDIPWGPREAAAWVEEERLGMKHLWSLIGQMDLYLTLASDESWKRVTWKRGPLTLTHVTDLAISKDRAKASSLSLKNHSLLTGPNRGGKSSALRGILQQVLLGQVFGYTYRAKGRWHPYQMVFTRLKSKDHAGRESLFEMEARMASEILHKGTRASSALVLIDELFHSTNPPDAEIAAKVFLQQLWDVPHIQSMISTHIFSLCETETSIQTLCCPATVQSDGHIQYTYTLQPGICKTSSVREVLFENDLLSSLHPSEVEHSNIDVDVNVPA